MSSRAGGCLTSGQLSHPLSHTTDFRYKGQVQAPSHLIGESLQEAESTEGLDKRKRLSFVQWPLFQGLYTHHLLCSHNYPRLRNCCSRFVDEETEAQRS